MARLPSPYPWGLALWLIAAAVTTAIVLLHAVTESSMTLS